MPTRNQLGEMAQCIREIRNYGRLGQDGQAALDCLERLHSEFCVEVNNEQPKEGDNKDARL